MTDAQSRYLRRMHAEKRELETCCDCPGCDICKGFVRGCNCDIDMEGFRNASRRGKDA